MDTSSLISVEDPQTKARVLNSGTILIARQAFDVPKFSLQARMRSGSLLDTTPGTAHLFEHLPLKVSKNYKNRSLDIHMQSLGGGINANTDYNNTNFFVEALNEHMEQVVHAAAELTCRPGFSKEELAHEIDIILTEELMRDYNRADIWRRMLNASLGARTPATVTGSLDEISSITQEDVWSFFNNNYFSQRLVVYAQGDHDPDKVLDLLEKSFVLPSGAAAEKIEYQFESDTKNFPSDARGTQATLIIQSPQDGATEQEVLASHFMKQALMDYNGPVYNRVRHQRPLTYAASTISPPAFFFPGTFRVNGLSFITFPEKIKATLDAMLEGIEAFIAKPDSATIELKKQALIIAEEQAIKNQPLYGPSDYLFSNIIHHGTFPARERSIEIASKLSVDDILVAAKRELSRTSVMYEGNIQQGFPDHNYINTALGNSTPRREVKVKALQPSPPTPAMT